MSERDRTRNRRRQQAEEIVNSLNSKNIKDIPLQKKIKKKTKKYSQSSNPVQNAKISSNPTNYLKFVNEEGNIKRVQFILKNEDFFENDKISNLEVEEDLELNLSDMLFNKYHALIKNKTVNENFYNKLIFDKGRILLCNEDKEDFFELYKKKGNFVENDFCVSEKILDEFNLKPLYGN